MVFLMYVNFPASQDSEQMHHVYKSPPAAYKAKYSLFYYMVYLMAKVLSVFPLHMLLTPIDLSTSNLVFNLCRH